MKENEVVHLSFYRSPKDPELKETEEILADKNQVERLVQALAEVKRGILFSHEQVFDKHP